MGLLLLLLLLLFQWLLLLLHHLVLRYLTARCLQHRSAVDSLT